MDLAGKIMACDLVKLATPGVAGLHPYQPGKPVQELERELGIKKYYQAGFKRKSTRPGRKSQASNIIPGQEYPGAVDSLVYGTVHSHLSGQAEARL